MIDNNKEIIERKKYKLSAHKELSLVSAIAWSSTRFYVMDERERWTPFGSFWSGHRSRRARARAGIDLAAWHVSSASPGLVCQLQTQDVVERGRRLMGWIRVSETLDRCHPFEKEQSWLRSHTKAFTVHPAEAHVNHACRAQTPLSPKAARLQPSCASLLSPSCI